MGCQERIPELQESGHLFVGSSGPPALLRLRNRRGPPPGLEVRPGREEGGFWTWADRIGPPLLFVRLRAEGRQQTPPLRW